MLKQKLESLVEEMIHKGIRFQEARQELEKRFITRVLERENGNLSRAAKVLRIHRNTLSKKIIQYKVRIPK